jgi:hypothetical protein
MNTLGRTKQKRWYINSSCPLSKIFKIKNKESYDFLLLCIGVKLVSYTKGRGTLTEDG